MVMFQQSLPPLEVVVALRFFRGVSEFRFGVRLLLRIRGALELATKTHRYLLSSGPVVCMLSW